MRKFVELCKLLIAVLLSKLQPSKHYWIVAERGYDARDNGYWFFLYLKKTHPEIESLYFITPDSVDSAKLSDYKESLIIPGLSIKSYLLLCQCDVFAGTHGLYWLYPRMFTYVLQKLCGTKFAFLQHGITLNSVPTYKYPTFLTDLFICGAEPEYNYICSNYGFNNKIVKLTGFCRFDNLHDLHVKRQILLMPTWRKWMWLEKESVKENEWVKRYASFLKSMELIKFLEEKDMRLLFYPHVEAQKYMPYFKSLNLSPRIILLDFNTADVQTLLIESALLITDYSSVFMDFAYMGKPLIFYQFDYDRYRKEHMAEGYFDYKNTLGDWCDSEEQLISIIKERIILDNNSNDNYANQVKKFFPYRDTNNCSRVFKAISETL